MTSAPTLSRAPAQPVGRLREVRAGGGVRIPPGVRVQQRQPPHERAPAACRPMPRRSPRARPRRSDSRPAGPAAGTWPMSSGRSLCSWCLAPRRSRADGRTRPECNKRERFRRCSATRHPRGRAFAAPPAGRAIQHSAQTGLRLPACAQPSLRAGRSECFGGASPPTAYGLDAPCARLSTALSFVRFPLRLVSFSSFPRWQSGPAGAAGFTQSGAPRFEDEGRGGCRCCGSKRWRRARSRACRSHAMR